MPVNKNALLRYRIIDSCLTNNMSSYPTISKFITNIEQQIGDGISESMIRKDLKAMKTIYNAPIEFSKERGGYYYNQEDFSLKTQPLTNEEIESLDFSTALLQQVKGTKMFEKFETAINKLIEGYRISKIIGRSETQIIQVEEPIHSRGKEWLEVILKGIINKECLSIHYQSFTSAEKVHCLSPYLLKEYRNLWYVVGHSDRVNKTIILALDRINQIEPSTGKFVNDESFHPDEFFKYSFGITQFHDEVPEKVILSFTPEQAQYILSHKLHHSQRTVLQTDTEVRVELTVYITQEIVMTILGYGKAVRVIAPESLKQQIRTTICELANEFTMEDTSHAATKLVSEAS